MTRAERIEAAAKAVVDSPDIGMIKVREKLLADLREALCSVCGEHANEHGAIAHAPIHGPAGADWREKPVTIPNAAGETGVDWVRWLREMRNYGNQGPRDREVIDGVLAQIDALTREKAALEKQYRDACRSADAAMNARNDAIADRDRLRAALERANANHEKFERLWYLATDELEKPCKGCGL
jgi:hypothetical protein